MQEQILQFQQLQLQELQRKSQPSTKGNNERWTVGKLRQFFNNYITARKAAESQSKETHTVPSSEEKQQSKIQSNSNTFQPKKYLSAEALTTIKPFGKNSSSGNSMVCR
ncbi:Hypothetical predicted protein [Mytilus galloprovincialis]|uniref:Uncharacterized protein n=1 Tax=Mytilus galloprovincialis TaxID=29158 RepID=A0A8B6FG89_MYTGA|nr:Hypothetical predicted protein [Mytilus galloprovincialis]